MSQEDVSLQTWHVLHITGRAQVDKDKDALGLLVELTCGGPVVCVCV